MKNEVRIMNTKGQRPKAKKAFLRMSSFWMVLFLLFTSYSFAQKVAAVVDSTQIKIGEEIKLSILVEADTTASVVFPEGNNLFVPLELLESYKTDTLKKEAKYSLIKKYGLTQFDSGTYFIPKQKILIDEKPFFTDSIRIAVADVAVDTLKQKMFEIKSIVSVEKGSSNWWKYLLIVLGLIILFGLYFYYFVFQLKDKKKKKKKAEIPPYDRALLQLNELDNSTLLLKSEYKNYYSELTNIVRQYIEEEVRIDALESTTAELIRKIEAQKDAGYLDLKDETIKNLKNVLQTADLVKFAKSKPDDAVIKADRNLVQHIVVETKEAIPEISEEERKKDEEYQLRLLEQQRKKRRFRNAAIGIVAMIIVFGGLIGYATISYIKENTYLGHSMSDLVDGEWVTSQYGASGFTIATPQVLKRMTPIKSKDSVPLPVETEIYAYQSHLAPFSIALEVVTFREKPKITLDDIGEQILKGYEARGATKLIVKYDEYESPTGIKGLKMYGTGIFVDEESPFGGTQESAYEAYIFEEGRGIQILKMLHAEDDEQAEKIVARILNSITQTENNDVR
ncbi:hypothetical protein U8527_00135 [Kordia algicida OT-1]|uniref:DUF4381 domain-containing protein n=1 Tax=Kordia algicida OT-1 TaxID=391587 RepID=A9DQU1_9FLAO|nr:hypothetical protein [Kordia algicida]EDP96695.1 hypothetical protein KAOT1_16068 [Kordia algicida OT-1]